MDPITITNKGDRKRLLAEHAVLVAAIDENGTPVPFRQNANGSAPASETHLGEVSTPADLVSLTPVLDTAAYDSGDTLFAATAIGNAVRVAGGQAILQSLTLIDKGDNGAAIDLFFFDSAVTFGAANAVPSISDSDAAKLLGIVSVATADYKDIGGAKVASLRGLGLVLEAASGRSVYVAAVVTGTPTYGASDIVLRFGLLW